MREIKYKGRAGVTRRDEPDPGLANEHGQEFAALSATNKCSAEDIALDAGSIAAPGAAERGVPEVTFEEKLAFLSRAEAYGGTTVRVERIETHLSFVFLTDRRVYKLKKPLRGEGFDYSRPRLRRRNAEEEVRLNRALAFDVYLRVIPLTLEESSRLALGGGGIAIDWLVEMVRLPAERTLEHCLAEGDWRRGDIAVLAARLARFFVTARRVEIAPALFIARFRAEVRATAEAVRTWAGAPLDLAARTLMRRTEAFLEKRDGLLERRAREHRPVDGHGDLRPEHIFLGSVPRIIDRLEFRADLRALDPVEELAYLALECERRGAPDIGPVLFDHYCARTKDRPPLALIAFYKMTSALIRARLAIRHLEERALGEPEKWRNRTAEYLAIATREARNLSLPTHCG